MYIGRDVDNISNVEKLDNITFDGSATYALEKSSVAYTPSGANNILISIDGVVQMGNFSTSTSNIVFDWSPTSSNTCDWILHYGTGLITTPADSSVTASKLGSLAVTGAKLNTDVISAQTELAVAPADADEFMVSDGGVLKRIDYSLIKGGDNTPAFQAHRTSYQSITNSTETKVENNIELFDTDGAYDNSTNYRFTVPSGKAGKYLIGAGNTIDNVTDQKWVITRVRKNGSDLKSVIQSSSGYPLSAELTFIDDASDGDYYESWVKHLDGSTSDLRTEYTNYFWMMRIIGA
jgi:hypothetical protein